MKKTIVEYYCLSCEKEFCLKQKKAFSSNEMVQHLVEIHKHDPIKEVKADQRLIMSLDGPETYHDAYEITITSSIKLVVFMVCVSGPKERFW